MQDQVNDAGLRSERLDQLVKLLRGKVAPGQQNTLDAFVRWAPGLGTSTSATVAGIVRDWLLHLLPPALLSTVFAVFRSTGARARGSRLVGDRAVGMG